MLIRNARPQDASGLARVEAETWRDAYPALLPEAFLVDAMDPGRRTVAWTRRLDRGGGDSVIIAQDPVAGCVGYAAFGRQRHRSLGRGGEIYELYVLPDFQGRGLGRRLCATVAERLGANGMGRLSVEVLEGNVSRYFYETLGGRLAARKRHRFQGSDLPSLVYTWDDIDRLAALASR